MARRVRMASEMACCSACRSALSANACDRTKIAASAASTRCRNFCGSLSRSAASNSRCQCGNFMFWAVEVWWSVIGSLSVAGSLIGKPHFSLLFDYVRYRTMMSVRHCTHSRLDFSRSVSRRCPEIYSSSAGPDIPSADVDPHSILILPQNVDREDNCSPDGREGKAGAQAAALSTALIAKSSPRTSGPRTCWWSTCWSNCGSGSARVGENRRNHSRTLVESGRRLRGMQAVVPPS